jgi:sugar phosphate isomerase/epimerase
MLTYALSVASLGGRLTDGLIAALGRHPPSHGGAWDLEVLPADWQPGGEDPDRLNDYLRLVGAGVVRVGSIHLPFGGVWDFSVADEAARQTAVARQLDVIDQCAPLGATQLTLHASAEPVDPAERRTRLGQALRSIEELLPAARRHGLRLAIEWLPRSCVGNQEEELFALTAPFSAEEVGILLDVNHVMARHAELPSIIGTLAPRLVALHLSDYNGIDECHWVPGDSEGVIDWHSVMSAIRALVRDVRLIVETRRTLVQGDPVGMLKRLDTSLAFLRGLGARTTFRTSAAGTARAPCPEF